MTYSRTHYPYTSADEALGDIDRENQRQKEAVRRMCELERARKVQRRGYARFFLACALLAAATYLFVVLAWAL